MSGEGEKMVMLVADDGSFARALPAEAIVPSRVVVTAEGAVHLAERMTAPRNPTRAMLALFVGK
ncbi:MAG TPA: hypothetical protein VF516_27450 [Kofleriaceae bacterium]